ncbi:hypothetical protein BCEP27_21003 [Burkholderia cepacia]
MHLPIPRHRLRIVSTSLVKLIKTLQIRYSD